MAEQYIQNYSQVEIGVILQKIKDCVNGNNYTISQNENRKENIQLINDYRLDIKKQKDILLSIAISDFCYTLNNKNVGYEHEVLYVFCPKRSLFDAFGNEELVDIYTKFNIIEYCESNRVIVVSFHKRNKPINYPFRV